MRFPSVKLDSRLPYILKLNDWTLKTHIDWSCNVWGVQSHGDGTSSNHKEWWTVQIPINKNIGTQVTQTKSYSTTLHSSEIFLLWSAICRNYFCQNVRSSLRDTSNTVRLGVQSLLCGPKKACANRCTTFICVNKFELYINGGTCRQKNTYCRPGRYQNFLTVIRIFWWSSEHSGDHQNFLTIIRIFWRLSEFSDDHQMLFDDHQNFLTIIRIFQHIPRFIIIVWAPISVKTQSC